MRHQEVRALYDRDSITVYQAFSAAIAEAALCAQTFVVPFSFERMTWIKPSFLWMMERSGWASKPNQERVLAVRIRRRGWEEALEQAVLTAPGEGEGREHWQEALQASPIRVQWDPERTLRGGKSEQRSIQVGIAREWSRKYATEWILGIVDVTPLVHKLQTLRKAGKWEQARRLLPEERVYPLSAALEKRLGIG